MSHNRAAFGNFDNAFGYFIKFGCQAQHGGIDSRKFYHKRLNRNFWIYQAYKLIHDFCTVKFINSNFGNSLFVELPAGGFYVYNCVHVLFLVAGYR